MSILSFRTASRMSAAITLLTVMLFCLLDAEQADASCGDYLMPYGAGHANEARAAQHGGPTEPMAASDSLPVRRPCDGPSCGGAPARTPVTATVAVSPKPISHGTLSVGSDLDDASRSWRALHGQSGLASSYRPLAIFRPPRCSG